MTPLLAWRPWAVAATAATLFLTGLGSSHLWDEDEAKNARCGAEMHQRGEWVVPTYNEELRSHKPVLLYWAMRASYAAFGENEFAARLPSALSGVLIAVMAYHLGRLLFDRTTGTLAALLLSTALMFSTLARAATPDGVLMLATTAALLAFVAGVSRLRGGGFSRSGTGGSGGDDGAVTPLVALTLPWPHTIAMYAAMGVAVLAKGPIGVLLPLWAIALYGLFGEPVAIDSRPHETWRQRSVRWFAASVAARRWWEGARSIRLLPGVAIVAAVAGPWYLAVTQQTGGDWLTGFLGTHNVGRFTGAMEGHDGRPFYYAYYVVAVLAGFFPASCFLPVSIVGNVARCRKGASDARSHAFALAVVAAWVGVFSIAATKLPNYVIPCYVGLATTTAAWLVERARAFDSAKLRTTRVWLGAGMASAAIVGVVLCAALGYVGGPLMGGTAWIGAVGLAPLVGGLAGLWLLREGAARRAVVAFGAACFAFAFAAHTLVGPAASPYADGPRIAAAVAALETATGRPLRVATHRYTTPTVVWELDRHVPGLEADAAAAMLAKPDAVVAMTREAYDELRASLAPSVGVLAEEGRFLRRHKRIVLVGDRTLSATLPGSPTAR
ncbi:MAG: glycosyltransferase family 39 protein [Planctomycetota bacterium]